ncbi:MAG: Gfo/Idh/MocA family oxidoreductase [Spirochaetales bacterium]|nr:Gfo/Idh/MocA family oxidoreductase [Spirochaetales bacterium]
MIDINTNIKIAVAGCGSAGRNNIRAFSGLDDVEIVACCDNDEKIAAFTAGQFGLASHYTEVKDMLEAEAVDVLVVAVPDGGHLEVSLEAFARGVHVFCENPLASNYAEAVEMTRAARHSGLTAAINFSGWNIPLLSSAVNSIKEGRLGRIRYMEAAYMQNRLDSRILDDPYEEKRLIWRLSKAAGSAGVIGELGSVLYDLAERVCGELAEVSTTISNIAGFDEVEEYQELDLTAGDTFISQLGFANGAAGLLRASWTAGGPHEQVSLTVYGEDGALRLDTENAENEYTLYTPDGPEVVSVDPAPETTLHENFISAVKGEAVLLSDFDHGLKIQYYIEQSMLSSDGGLRLQLNEEY